MVVVRFAPSPTGMLHIGSARTALFNYLFAKHHGGKFLLRIEDTDKDRSTQEAVDAIHRSLEWLGLHHDDAVVIQSERLARHGEVAEMLVSKGKAYYCYCSQAELEAMREEARKNNQTPKYNGMWRDKDPSLAPKDIKPVIRLKAPQSGQTVIHDLVQGDVKVDNKHLDDMVLLRSDGTPTYMLSVVVDDHDMGITHIIRGDDHLNNAFRQYYIYEACGWDVPKFAHIPLIHGSDGAKLSKRHGAVSTEVYKDMGYLPEAMRNYLLRLGWGHGDAEIISDTQAIEWFDLDHVGRSASRFDFAKLNSLNAHYIKNADNARLLDLITPLLDKNLFSASKDKVLKGMNGLKDRAKTLMDLAWGAEIYLHKPALDEKIVRTNTWIQECLDVYQNLEDFSEQALDQETRDLATKHDVKLGVIAMALRTGITGRSISPSLFEVMSILGKDETVNRLKNHLLSD